MSGDCGIVTFVYADWIALFPELSSISDTQATLYFGLAGAYCDNSACSTIFPSTPNRSNILYLITAHIASILGAVNGNDPSPLVGRISNVTEGSVSIATDMPSNPSAAWWNQTKYGALAWQALLPYRSATYFPAPQIPLAAQSWPGAGFGYGLYGRRGWR